MQSSMFEHRAKLRQHLLGDMPRLWCPPLTHYTTEGTLDAEQITAHWAWMQKYVKGFLVPGSTSDGWELSDEELDALLGLAFSLATRFDVHILIGVLKPTAEETVTTVRRLIARLRRETGLDNSIEAMRQARVAGFTICAPHGKTLTQEGIRAGLEATLALGLPTALYQLPQVTQNTIAPATALALAESHDNILYFKDSSGKDAVPLEDDGRTGIFLMRGAEGEYWRWLREADGPYHGFLLSTANCFPAHLAQIVTLVEEGHIEEARAISNRIDYVIQSAFRLTQGLPYGNPFTNANKAMAHFMAYGRRAFAIEPPMLHAGVRLPVEIIRRTGELLDKADLIPETGYLEA